jgi:hypothetical protein
MRTVALYLDLVLGIASFIASGFILRAAYRCHEGNTRGNLMFVVGLALFFAVTGSLWVTAFAAPSARKWAIYAGASLLIARGVAFFVAGRVIKWRERISAR